MVEKIPSPESLYLFIFHWRIIASQSCVCFCCTTMQIRHKYIRIVVVLVPKLCPTLCDSMDYSLPGSFVHGITQARILELVAISFSRGSFQLRDWTRISYTGRWILYHWATKKAQVYIYSLPFEPLSLVLYISLAQQTGKYFHMNPVGVISGGLGLKRPFLQWLEVGFGFPARDWVWVRVMRALSPNH